MKTLVVILIALILTTFLGGCEQTEAEKTFWNGTEKLGKHIAREMLKDD